MALHCSKPLNSRDKNICFLKKNAGYFADLVRSIIPNRSRNPAAHTSISWNRPHIKLEILTREKKNGKKSSNVIINLLSSSAAYYRTLKIVFKNGVTFIFY